MKKLSVNDISVFMMLLKKPLEYVTEDLLVSNGLEKLLPFVEEYNLLIANKIEAKKLK